MAVGYLEHDNWLEERMGTINMGKPGGEFRYAVVELPSAEDIGVAFWNGAVFCYRDDDEEDFYSIEDLTNMVRDMDMGRHSEFSSVSDLIDYNDESEMPLLDLYLFDNSTEGIDDYDTGVREESDNTVLAELVADLQRFWKGVDWSDKEKYAGGGEE